MKNLIQAALVLCIILLAFGNIYLQRRIDRTDNKLDTHETYTSHTKPQYEVWIGDKRLGPVGQPYTITNPLDSKETLTIHFPSNFSMKGIKP